MARAIWSGAISFGLVSVPVKLFSATSSHRISFNQFEEGTGARIRYKRVSDDSGEEVPYERIVKGYEVDEGRFVTVTPEELEATEPGRSRTIDIEDFVSLDAIDPMVWNDTYYLGPDGEAAAKPYALLREAMRRTGRVAIGRFVMRGKQYLATIRPLSLRPLPLSPGEDRRDGGGGGDALVIETMYFADEVRSLKDIEQLPVDVELSDRELATAEQLVEALSAEWDHAAYRDTYTERVRELIERKLAGEEVVIEAPEPLAEVTDLMAALRASVEASAQRRKVAGGDGTARVQPAEAEDELAGLTKDELYERAARAGIAGRSKLSKDQLIEALRGQRAS